MSGGSLNYAYSALEETAIKILRRAETPLHKAFAAHLLKVSKALHDLEWVFSSDYGPGEEIEAIKAVVSPLAELESATEAAQQALKDLQAALDGVKK